MPTNEEIEQVRRGLVHWQEKRRKSTLNRVRALPLDEAVAILAGIFQVADRKRARTIAVARIGALASLLLICASGAAASELAFQFGILALLLILAMIPLCVMPYILGRLCAYPTDALTLLKERPDPRLVAPLLQTMALPSVVKPEPMLEALAASLALISAEDYAALTVAERGTLIRQLSIRFPPLQKSILNALRLGNDASAIAAIERHCQGDRSLQPELDACLKHLQAVRDAERIGATLLRASNQEIEPEMLLRASQSKADDQSEQLLRPMDS